MVIYEVKNKGNSQWSENTELRCIAGLNEGISEGIPSLEKDEKYAINLLLQAPEKPGRYSSSWRLCYRVHNDLIYFGPRMTFEIKIESKILLINLKQK